MNKFRTSLLVSAILMASGCSTLSSSSAFEDVASSVEQRQNYVQVIAKDIVPETQAIVGPDIIKSSLYYVGNFSKNPNVSVTSSYVDLNIMTFKNYDQFDSVTVGGEQIGLVNYRPQSETCTEHCIVTQWVQFPYSHSSLEQVQGSNVEFTLSSSANKNVVKLTVPKAYFEAVESEARYAMLEKQAPVQQAAVVETAEVNKPQEMVQYWFNEASASEQKEFADWAFNQRTSVSEMIKAETKPVEMMAYWYEKANKTEKSNILFWLLRQE